MSLGPKVLVSVVTLLSFPIFKPLIFAVEALNLQASAMTTKSPRLITSIDLGVCILLSPSFVSSEKLAKSKLPIDVIHKVAVRQALSCDIYVLILIRGVQSTDFSRALNKREKNH